MNFSIPPQSSINPNNHPNFPVKQNGELISPSTSPNGRLFYENFFSMINNNNNNGHHNSNGYPDNSNNYFDANNIQTNDFNSLINPITNNVNNNDDNSSVYNNNVNNFSENHLHVLSPNNEAYFDNFITSSPSIDIPSTPTEYHYISPSFDSSNNSVDNISLDKLNGDISLDLSDLNFGDIHNYPNDSHEDAIWNELSSSEYWNNLDNEILLHQREFQQS